LSNAEINEHDNADAESESLDSTADKNFFSKVLSLLITVRFCKYRVRFFLMFLIADLLFAISLPFSSLNLFRQFKKIPRSCKPDSVHEGFQSVIHLSINFN
jgi:hypothetical protein